MKYRIDTGKKMFLMGIALCIDFFDMFTGITGIGIIFAFLSGFLKYGIIWVFFATNGINFFGTKKRINRAVWIGIIESIPIINLLPVFSLGVWQTIEETRKEDRKKQGGKLTNIIRPRKQKPRQKTQEGQ